MSKTFVNVALPLAAQDRDVLAAGVQHDLDRGVGEHLGQRRGVERRRSSGSSTATSSPTDDLDQAQQRPVAALRHELGVDPEPALRACALRQARDLRGGRGIRHFDTTGGREKSTTARRGNWLRITASHAAVGEQAALGDQQPRRRR